MSEPPGLAHESAAYGLSLALGRGSTSVPDRAWASCTPPETGLASHREVVAATSTRADGCALAWPAGGSLGTPWAGSPQPASAAQRPCRAGPETRGSRTCPGPSALGKQLPAAPGTAHSTSVADVVKFFTNWLTSTDYSGDEFVSLPCSLMGEISIYQSSLWLFGKFSNFWKCLLESQSGLQAS